MRSSTTRCLKSSDFKQGMYSWLDAVASESWRASFAIILGFTLNSGEAGEAGEVVEGSDSRAERPDSRSAMNAIPAIELCSDEFSDCFIKAPGA